MTRIITTTYHDGSVQPPLTLQQWQERHPIFCHCLTFRGASWLRTYISEDGTRSVCEYEAPYVDIIREVFRETNISFDQIWSADVDDMPGTKICVPNPFVMEFEQPLVKSSSTWTTSLNDLNQSLENKGISILRTLKSVKHPYRIWFLDTDTSVMVKSISQQQSFPAIKVWRSQLLTNPSTEEVYSPPIIQ